MRYHVMVGLFLLGSVNTQQAGFGEKIGQPSSTQQLFKESLQHAYKGELSVANQMLHNAADHDNLPACLLLARSYTQGSWLTESDAIQAAHFNKQATILNKRYHEQNIQRLKALYNNDYERFGFSHQAQEPIARLDAKINRIYQRLEAIHFAQENSWYQEIVDALAHHHTCAQRISDGFPTSHKPMKVLPIQEGIEKLVTLYLNKEGAPYEALVEKAVRLYACDDLNQHIIKRLKNSSSIDNTKKRFLLSLIHSWALTHEEVYDALKTIYSNQCHDYHWMHITRNISQEEQAHAQTDMIALFPHYFKIDPTESIERFTYFLQKIIERLPVPNWNTFPIAHSTLIPVLSQARTLQPAIFAHHIPLLLDKKITELLMQVLSFPEEMHLLEDTPLSSDAIIQYIFTQTSALASSEDIAQKNAYEALGFLFKQGGSLHEKYCERIIAILPLFIANKPYEYSAVSNLLSSPIKALRHAAFTTLVEAIVSICSAADQSYLIESYSQELFNASLTIEEYNHLVSRYHETRAILPLQLVWHHWACLADEQLTDMLNTSILRFFNLPAQESIVVPALSCAESDTPPGNPTAPASNQQHTCCVYTDPWKAFFQAVEQESIPPTHLRQFLIEANRSSLIKSCNLVRLNPLKIKLMCHEETPVKERCQFLSDVLIEIHTNHQSLDEIQLIIQELPQSPFKEYAQTVLDTLQSQSCLSYYRNRHKLLNFRELNTDFPAIPEIIGHYFIAYPNMFNWNTQDVLRKSETSQKHYSLSSGVLKAHFDKVDKNVIYGYQRCSSSSSRDYRLYAFDTQTGYALWATDFLLEKPITYAIGQTLIACLKDDNSLAIIDKHNGQLWMTISMPDDTQENKIINLIITPTEQICLVCKKSILFLTIDNATQNINQREILLPENIFNPTYQHIMVSDGVICFEQSPEKPILTTLLHIGATGTITRVPLDPIDLEHEIWSIDHSITHDHYLIFTQQIGNSTRVVCFDRETNTIEWQYLTNPVRSLIWDNNALYVLNEKELIALNCRISHGEHPQEIWRTDVRGSFLPSVDSIALFDEDSLYGFLSHGGDLIHINRHTGEQTRIYEIKEGRGHRLLGVANNRIYIQPY